MVYVVCSLEEDPRHTTDSNGRPSMLSQFIGFTKNPMLIRQFIHCMAYYMDGYLYDEWVEGEEPLEQQLIDWANTIPSSIICSFDQDYINKEYDEIHICSSHDDTIFVALTDDIVINMMELLYDDYSILLYHGSSTNHTDMIHHVLYVLEYFVRDVMLREAIKSMIVLLADVYSIDNVIREDYLDMVACMVHFLHINPIG